jgi:iron-sulfur cluster repair protein YtfE (RIC family)
MDKLLKHAQQQGEIFESLSFFNKAMVAEGKKGAEYLQNISKLFAKDIIAHLKFEEGRIFPLVFSDGALKDKRLIRSLQREHIDILEKIDQFKDLFSKFNSQSQGSKSEVKDLVGIGMQIIQKMLAHSRKEDRELFPLLKRLGYALKS